MFTFVVNYGIPDVCDYCKMENPGDVMFCVSCKAPLTEPSKGAIGLTGASVSACPLIKKLPFRIHPAPGALAVFLLFLAGVFMG